jgi:hypothetical protein
LFQPSGYARDSGPTSERSPSTPKPDSIPLDGVLRRRRPPTTFSQSRHVVVVVVSGTVRVARRIFFHRCAPAGAHRCNVTYCNEPRRLIVSSSVSHARWITILIGCSSVTISDRAPVTRSCEQVVSLCLSKSRRRFINQVAAVANIRWSNVDFHFVRQAGIFHIELEFPGALCETRPHEGDSVVTIHLQKAAKNHACVRKLCSVAYK